MKIAVLRETAAQEQRVAITPDIVKKIRRLGVDVYIESGAGVGASISDQEFIDAGAVVSKVPLEIIADADVIFKVQASVKKIKNDLSELSISKEGAVIIGMLGAYNNKPLFEHYAKRNLSSFSMELMPRITRAQSMDVLSSQNNLIGYRGVIEAASEYKRGFPMMVTAAGTVAAAKVLVLGAGVSGLQAIATARRMGAIVSAFDVRKVAKEQVESLGAKFIEVPGEEDGSTNSGYAREMSDDYKAKQAELLQKAIINNDIIITTALIPGKVAPLLLPKDMVAQMRTGSVIVDLAAIAGGNCEATKEGKIVEFEGIKIIGYTDFASRIAADASKLYANNIFNFFMHLFDNDNKVLKINQNDEITAATLMTYNSSMVNKIFQGAKK